MQGMGDAGEGHMTERHHLAGLLLLLIVSFQTANGFLRPPREFVIDDEHDGRSSARGVTARNLWHFVHAACGLTIFGLGAYQVHSGLGIFARRFSAPDWGSAYVGYTLWLVGLVIVTKLYLKWQSRRSKKDLRELQAKDLRELQMGMGSNLPNYDVDEDFAVDKFETV